MEYQIKGLTRDEVIREMENLMSWERLEIIDHFSKEAHNSNLNVTPNQFIKNKTVEEILSCYPIETIEEYIERVKKINYPETHYNNTYVTGMEESKKPF